MKHIQKIAPFAAMAVGAVLALATSAFSNAPHKTKGGDPMYAFEYTAPGGSYEQGEVQTNGNWQYTSDNSSCSTYNVKACKIYVTADDVTSDGQGGYNLNSNFVINASSGSTSHVNSTTDGSGSDYVSNRNN